MKTERHRLRRKRSKGRQGTEKQPTKRKRTLWMQTASQLATTDRAVLVNLQIWAIPVIRLIVATDLATIRSNPHQPYISHTRELENTLGSELPNILTSHQISLSIGRSLVALFPGLKWMFRKWKFRTLGSVALFSCSAFLSDANDDKDACTIHAVACQCFH